MKRITCLSFLLLAVLATSFVTLAQEPAKPDKPLVIQPAKPTKKAEPHASILRRDLSLRRARELGLTVANIRAAVDELKSSGEVDDSTTRAEASVLVAAHMKASRGEEFGTIADLDWDAIFAFIEKIMALFNLV